MMVAVSPATQVQVLDKVIEFFLPPTEQYTRIHADFTKRMMVRKALSIPTLLLAAVSLTKSQERKCMENSIANTALGHRDVDTSRPFHGMPHAHKSVSR